MSDFIKVGTNQENMKGGVQDKPNEHHIHCCHDGSCPQMCQDHGVPANNEHEGSNEHTEPGNIKDREEVGQAGKGSYPGFIRKMR